MSIFAKLFPSTELKAIRGVLDEAEQKFDTDAFRLVRSLVEKSIEMDPASAERSVSGGTSPRQVIYAAIANIAGDLLESGRYHIYRGTLNPMGVGSDLLTLYNAAIDELVHIKAIDASRGEEEKAAIQRQIRTVG